MTDESAASARRLGAWLIIGIVVWPLVFAWFTLRRGHTRASRYAAFAHLGFAVLLGVSRVIDMTGV